MTMAPDQNPTDLHHPMSDATRERNARDEKQRVLIDQLTEVQDGLEWRCVPAQVWVCVPTGHAVVFGDPRSVEPIDTEDGGVLAHNCDAAGCSTFHHRIVLGHIAGRPVKPTRHAAEARVAEVEAERNRTPTEPGWYRALFPKSFDRPERWGFVEVGEDDGVLHVKHCGSELEMDWPSKWGQRSDPAAKSETSSCSSVNSRPAGRNSPNGTPLLTAEVVMGVLCGVEIVGETGLSGPSDSQIDAVSDVVKVLKEALMNAGWTAASIRIERVSMTAPRDRVGPMVRPQDLPAPGTRVRMVGGEHDGVVGVYQGWVAGSGCKVHDGTAKCYGPGVTLYLGAQGRP